MERQKAISEGLTALIDNILDDVSAASSRGEHDLYKYTCRYFALLPIARDFLGENIISEFEKRYMTIIENHVSCPMPKALSVLADDRAET